MPALGHDIPDAHVFTQPWPATAAEKAHGIAPGPVVAAGWLGGTAPSAPSQPGVTVSPSRGSCHLDTNLLNFAVSIRFLRARNRVTTILWQTSFRL
jgi:hypothetical protein